MTAGHSAGAVPQRSARIEIQTDTGTTYSALFDETHWTLALDRGDLPTAVGVYVSAMDGTVFVREGCLLAHDDRYQPTRLPWRRRWARRGCTTYEPGSGWAWRREAFARRARSRRDS
jgi:hypothetical protein